MNKLNKAGKIIIGIMLLGIGFALSAFGMYKYNEIKTFNNLASQGNQYMIQENYDKAIQVFQQALSYKNDSGVQTNLVLAQNFKNENSIKDTITKNIKLANEAAKNNKFDEANKYLNEILKIDPDNTEAKTLKDSFNKAVQDQEEKAKEQEQAKVKEQAKENTSKTQSDSSISTRVQMTSEKALKILENAYPEYTYVSGGEMNTYPWQPYEGQPAYRFIFKKNEDNTPYVGFVLMDGRYALRFANGI